MDYTELQVTTNFSFLRGASHPEEMVEQAATFGYKSIAITDTNTLSGVVRAHVAAKKTGVKLIPGCRVELVDGPAILALPMDIQGYAILSNLLTTGNRRTEKGKCELYKGDIQGGVNKLKWIVLPPEKLTAGFEFPGTFKSQLHQYREIFGSDLSIAMSCLYNGQDAKRMFRIAELAKNTGIKTVATNDVHYHHPSRRELQDVVTCVREKCTIYTAGYKLFSNSERHLKPVNEMIRLFRKYPEAIEQTQAISQACTFSLHELNYQYPKEITSDGRTPQQELIRLTWFGANQIYRNNIPAKIKANIEYELKFIDEMNYAAYFLTVYDIVRYAREQKILCQGRGSAANSTVCFCLGITSVDPSKFDLLFERFISSARNEPPDIDVDFEHERREEVIQYIYNKYCRDRAAIVGTVTQQHHRGAIRDVGKAMGVSADTLSRLSGLIWDFSDEGFNRERIVGQGINPDDPTIRKVLQLTSEFMGFPRQLGQHTGGFVITEGKLSDLCPIMNARMEDRTCIEWNKDDIEALGFLKMDVLALGMLTCIRKGFDLAGKHYQKDLTLANIPQDDPEVYEMVTAADTIGVFQIESRAQQSMLPRLKPKCFYDLVIEVAIVRPGPIQGDMVHPYLRRRNGEEPVEYPSKELEEILSRTLGVPLFQEQAMKIAIVAAGFSPAEADELRRSMATFKAKGKVSYFQDKLVNGMIAKGYSPEYAQRVFRQLEGFGSYGFPESHAVSFALLVYVSAWIKCYYPDIFACALLNSMPMGFYQPAQIVIDARNHGVEIRPVDVNYSDWDNQLEERSGRYHALRLGFRQVKGLSEQDIRVLLSGRTKAYSSILGLRKAGVGEGVLERLADADAFRSMGMDRRQALWHVTGKENVYDFFAGESSGEMVALPEMSLSEHVVHDYASTSLSLKAHPLSFIREQLVQLRSLSAADLVHAKNGEPVKVAGLVLVRQRPGTAKGVCFITLEDETGTINLIIFKKQFDDYRKEIIQSKLLLVEGELQKEAGLTHVIVKRSFNATRMLHSLSSAAKEHLEIKQSRSDETTTPVLGKTFQETKVYQTSIFPDGRNFK